MPGSLQRLLAWFAPPLFPGDPEKTRRAGYLNVLLLLESALGLFLPSMVHMFAPLPWYVIAGAGGASVVYLLIRAWMFQGAVMPAALIFFLSSTAAVTFFMVQVGTVHTALTGMYLLIIYTAAVVLDMPMFLLVLGFNALNLAGLTFAETMGWLPPGQLNMVGAPLDWGIIMGLLAAVIFFSIWTRKTIHAALSSFERALEERVRAEEALRRSRDFYQGLLNGLDDPVMVKDIDGQWILLNDSAVNMFNIDRERWLGRTDFDLQPPKRAAQFAEVDLRVLRSGVPLVFEEEVPAQPAKGLPERTITIKKSLVTDPSTGERFIVSVVRDITERKRMEDELRMSEASLLAAHETLERRVHEQTAELRETNESLQRSMRELEHFMNANPGMVYMFRQDGKIMRWNQRFEDVLEYSAQEIATLHMRRLIHKEDKRAALTAFFEGMKTGQSSVQLRLVAKSGKPIPILSTGSMFAGEDGWRYFIGVGVDITERLAAEAALRESEMRYRNLIESIPDIILVINYNGDLVYANPAMQLLVDFAFLSQPYGDQKTSLDLLFHPDDVVPVDAAYRAFKKSDLPSSEPMEFRIIDQEGKLHWFSARLARIVFHGEPAVQVIGRDITAMKQIEEALRASEERYALAALGANDGLWDLDMVNGNTMYLSPRFREILGDPDMPEYIADHDQWWRERVHPDDAAMAYQVIFGDLMGGHSHLSVEFRLRHHSGSYRWVLLRGVTVRNAEGKIIRAAGSMTDITERKRAEAQLIHDALHDALTGLPNRALLCDRLEQAILHFQRQPDARFAVLFMDLDHFKDINDSHGHPVGDQLLVAAANRVLDCIRASDTLARLGGDEFVVLQTGIHSHDDAILLAERVQAALAMPFQLEGPEVLTSTSIGIVLADDSHGNAQDLLRDADIAMYRAKAQGRTRHEVFDASMRSHVFERMRLEADMRIALQNGEFEVFYHPILAMAGSTFTGFEALARWRHPRRGLIPPSEFIPLAEENGLIIPLDRWVLRQACQQVRAWQKSGAGPIRVSVNLSGKQFSQPDLVQAVQQALEESKLPPHSLLVEITESAIMENIALATDTLRQIQALGVQVEIDDFGTGFSSLTYLVQLPVNLLKIDRSFTTQLGSDGRKSEIVDTIIRLAHNLNLDVVAEGVETPEQLAALRAMDCDFAQGYLFARPLAKEEAEDWMQQKLNTLIRFPVKQP